MKIKSILKKCMIVVIPLLIGIAIGFYWDELLDGRNTFISKKELDQAELYIYNRSCSEMHESRVVDNVEYYNEILHLCSKVKKFRPISSLEIMAGETSDTVIYIYTDSHRYAFSFSWDKVKKQISMDYLHRDQPLLGVMKTPIISSGTYGRNSSWYGYLSPEEYITLYDLAAKYTIGEIVLNK